MKILVETRLVSPMGLCLTYDNNLAFPRSANLACLILACVSQRHSMKTVEKGEPVKSFEAACMICDCFVSK